MCSSDLVDNTTLYFAGNVLFKTLDRGNSWEVISPDLTRSTWDIPSSVGIYTSDAMKTMPRRGVIYTIAPSYKDIQTIWIGTDDGLIQVTRDGGKTWKNVTPPQVSSWSKISLMEASHTDVNTAYAAVNRIRCDDMKPHIYKTTDGGKTWREIVTGLPDDPINVVKEDPLRKGLLFAGSERAAYVSFDDGEHWQSLKLNMPPTSIRDLIKCRSRRTGRWLIAARSSDNRRNRQRQGACRARCRAPLLFRADTVPGEARVRVRGFTGGPGGSPSVFQDREPAVVLRVCAWRGRGRPAHPRVAAGLPLLQELQRLFR